MVPNLRVRTLPTDGIGASACAVRDRARSCRSGAGSSSKVRKSSSRSRIVFLQDAHEPSPTAAEVHANRRASDAKLGSDLSCVEADVVMQDQDRALHRCQPTDRSKELGRLPVGRTLRVPVIGQRGPPPALLQLACGDAKGGSPEPCARITDSVSSTQALRERLRYRVARKGRILGEREDCTPKLRTLFGEDPIEPIVGSDVAWRTHLSVDRAIDGSNRVHASSRWLPKERTAEACRGFRRLIDSIRRFVGEGKGSGAAGKQGQE